MKLAVFFIGLTIFGSLCFSTLAQTAPTESKTEREKIQKELEKRVLEILDQTVGDAATLKLARNRATVYASAGDLYWKFDEKRARELFRRCESEIMIDNDDQEKEKRESEDLYVDYGLSTLRGEVLPKIAAHDADLALQILTATRPAKIAAELVKAAQPNARQEGGLFNFSPERYRVQQEIALEQQFAVQAAEQNPDKAIKLFKDSLAKGVSWNVVPLLERINQKDEKKAVALADDVIRKLVDSDLMKKRDDLNAAIQLFQYATSPNERKNSKEKVFKFSETQVRDIANKIALTFLQPTNTVDVTLGMSRLMPNLEKIVPEKIPLLKQRQAELMKNLPADLKRFQEREKIWNPNSTPEEILADLPKFNEEEKNIAYSSLSHKIAQIEDEPRARKLIEQITDEKARAQANDMFESTKIGRAVDEGKLDEAKKLIKNLNEKKTQVQRLVALAVRFHKKNTAKDLETAAALMKDAKALVSEAPEDEYELNDLMQVVQGYAIVDPPEAFRLFEPIVDQLNDFVQASAILSKYNKRSRVFKKGELLMSVNNYSWDSLLLFRYIVQMQTLGKADLNRMSSLSDKFQRADARTIVKLFIVQGFLMEEEKEKIKTGSGDGGFLSRSLRGAERVFSQIFFHFLKKRV